MAEKAPRSNQPAHVHARLAIRAVAVALACVASAMGASTASAAGASAAVGDVVRIRLATGDVITCELVRRQPGSVVVHHPVLGELTIPAAQIEEIQPVSGAAARPAGDAEAAPLPAPAPSAATRPGMAPPPLDPSTSTVLPVGPSDAEASAVDPTDVPKPPRGPWRATIAAGVNYTDNNDQTLDARIAAGANYEIPDVEELALSAEYFFKTLNSNTTDNNLLVNGVYNRFIGDTPWLWFVKAQYQYSQFEAWEHRISGYGGVGYQVFKLPPVDLLLKVGAGATYEFGPPSQTLPEGYGEAQFAWQISELQRLEMSGNIAPDLSNMGEFRVISRAEWQCKIDPLLDLALTFGVRWQYQSEVPAGDVNYDLRVYAGLQVGF